jgi:hypothetical protein
VATDHRRGDPVSGLTAFQEEVARLFFALPASDGFLLAGGGALLATGLSSRPTEDLDFFGERGRADVAAASTQFETAVAARGWTVSRLQNSPTFVRLHLVGDDELLVDIGIDVAAGHPPVVSLVGPTFEPEELAGRKLGALFGRAEARDFVDVYVLAHRFGQSVLLERAAELDLGFDRGVLAEMMRTLARFADDELPIDATEVPSLRIFFLTWADELTGGPRSE